MFDLPRKVKEFSCMCCGERFWTVEGSVQLFADESMARQLLKKETGMELSIMRHN